jgi:DNA-binding response OmpR family regulator
MGGAIGTATTLSSRASGRKLILVVDDDTATRVLVARALSDLYNIRQAVDGRAAMCELAKLPIPDLVILDVMMPNMDGLTFAAKADPKFRFIPIIFLSAKESPADLIKGIRAGARSYLTKPFKIEMLRDTVTKRPRRP